MVIIPIVIFKERHKMKSYRIHMIRHGITQGNIDGQYVGSTDLPLCGQGIDMINELKETFEYPYVDRVYVSPMKRCIETAELIYPNAELVAVEDVREMDFGVFEGKSMEDLKDDPDFGQWAASGFTGAPPEGEGMVEFGGRCKEAFCTVVDNMMREGVENAALVVHGGVIMTIMAQMCLEKRENPAEWLVNNGVGFTAKITPRLFMDSQVFEVENILPLGLYDYGNEEMLRTFSLEEDDAE